MDMTIFPLHTRPPRDQILPRYLPKLGTRVFCLPANASGMVVARCFSLFTVGVLLDDGTRYADVSVNELDGV